MTAAEDLGVFPDELRPPFEDAIAEFDDALSGGRKREAAEMAYAIAVRLQTEGRVRDAARYGRASLALYEALPTGTFEQCTPTQMKVAGVSLPDYLHEDVIRSRLATCSERHGIHWVGDCCSRSPSSIKDRGPHDHEG